MKTNYVLIDLENVVPENLDVLDQEWFKIKIFYGAHQTKIPISLAAALQKFGMRVEYVKSSRPGPNALDFHIAYYLGKIAAEEKDVYFHVVSKDHGFDSVIEHLRENKIPCDRVVSLEEIPIIRNPPVQQVAKSSLAEIKAQIEKSTHPRKMKTLKRHVATLDNSLSEKEIDNIISRLFADGFVKETGTRLVYSFESAEK